MHSMDCPDFHQVKLSSLSPLSGHYVSCRMLVCLSLNAPMSRSPCRVAYGKSSSHRVFSLELRISLLLQIAIFTFKKHLIEGVISILISG